MRRRPEILFGLLTRATQTAMLLGSAVLVAWRMPTAEQGYFWAMGGLAALIQVGELGLTQVVLQSAAHYAAQDDHERLARFWRTARRLAGLVFPAGALLVLALGFVLLGTPDPASEPAWRAPWVVFVLAMAGCQSLAPGIGFIEGAVSIPASWRFQGRLELASGVVLIGSLVAGAGLWSLPLYACARFALTLAWLAARRGDFPARADQGLGAREWRSEIWPFQWKIAITAVTSFLIYRAFTPIVLAGMGAEAAARFGLSLAVMASWLAITVAWPSSQTGRVGTLASQGRSEELRRVFRAMFIGSTGFAAGGAALILAGLWLVDRAGLPFAERSAGFAATGMLLASGVIQHAVLCASILLRSTRRDPLLPYSVAGSVITSIALWYAAHLGELSYIAFAYLACSCLGLLMGLHAFVVNVPAWRAYLRAA